ncbi:MAG: S49 family peptidase [Candidatus Thiodiazotropha sp. (ex Monitilora ramsayi)]|nr:S49 family peptidase [Candidatus Thiodiazotropha sp. (ex Monitilora ramsayi)]
MYNLLIDLAFNQPHLVTADRLDALSSFLLSQAGWDIEVPDQPEPMAFAAADGAIWSDNGYWVDGGIGIIDINGTMVHKAVGMQALSGITSYDALSRKFTRAMNDPAVRAILLNMDTPGGAVNGAFDLADKIYQARGVKPVEALAADRMASAGYLIGSSAERINVTQTAQVGSIGVVMKHLDISKWNNKTGLSPTYIYAGERKVEGNMDQPLSKEVKGRFQEKIDTIYDMFAAVEERNRGLSRQAIIDTKADIFLGDASVAIDLADDVTTGEALIERMKSKYSAGFSRAHSSTAMEKTTMSETAAPQPAAESGAGTEAAAAAEQEAAAVDTRLIEANARQEERVRCNTILTSEAAEGRMTAAISLATDTEMPAEAAIAALEKMPVEAESTSRLDKLMRTEDNPSLGSDTVDGGEMSASQLILKDHAAATGRKGA